MRELTNKEIGEVDGGVVNLVAYAYYTFQAVGYASAGGAIGTGVNYVNESFSNMSLGEAIYRTVN